MSFSRTIGRCIKSCAIALCLIATARAAENWDNRFVPPPDTDGEVFAVASVGNQFYVGGSFSTVNGVNSPGIAKWNGTSWESVGGGTDGEVYAIAISGNNVFIGGSFSLAGDTDALNVALWNGTYWTNLAAGLDDSFNDAEINSLLVSGTNLFAAGYFENSDTNAMTNIARWNGTAWLPLGAGINYTTTNPNDTQGAYVNALAGSSTSLYVGGFFNAAGTSTVTNIAHWNGTTWASVGAGLDYTAFLPDDTTTPEVVSLAVSGTNLYAGGVFNISGATEVDNFAVWNGTSWSMVGGAPDDSVNAIIATNNSVYIGGDFTTIDSVVANGIARWTNSHWEPLNIGIDGSVDCLALTSSNLFAGGDFTSAGGAPAANIARWNNVNWNTLALGVGNAPLGQVAAICLSGSNVFVGGQFNLAGTAPATNVALWNGNSWTNLGGGVDGFVFGIGGNATNLIVGGTFDSADGIPAANIARWNGTAWTNMGDGVDGVVYSIATLGTNLFIAGGFKHSGSNAINNIARWNGTSWSPVGGGLYNPDYPNSEVFSLATMGNSLFACGTFTTDGTNSLPSIARWDGTSWGPVGTNSTDFFGSLAANASNLYAGGIFTFPDGSSSSVARWDGTNLFPVGSRFDADGPSIAVSGSNLFACGSFTEVGTNFASYVTKWDGQTWIPLAGGLDEQALCVAADGTNVYVGGDFTYAGDSPSYHFGIWNDRPPNIWSLPETDQVVSAGTNLFLSASVAGLQPITYQWFRNGIAIAGATNSSYVDTNIQSADVGNYTVLASNIYGSVLSDPVSVQLDSVVVFSDNFESGTVSNWTKLSTSSPLIISTNKVHNGSYSALATNSLAKMYHNLGIELEGHSMATFWIYDDGGTQTRWSGDVRNYSGGGFATGTLQQQMAIGLYATNFGTGTGDLAGEIVDTNSYQGQILAGDSTGYFNLDDSPFQRTNGWHKFQIERQDDPTTVDFWIDDDIYREIYGAAGTTWDSLTIGSMATNGVPGNVWFDDVRVEYFDPPDIITNPVDQAVNPGANVTFNVVATGNIRSYQWLKNDSLIAGATKSSLTVTNAQQAATYSVLVANGIGVTQSDDAVLTIYSKPTILAQPQSINLPAGANFALSVTATGLPDSLGYQWRKNGTAITGATISDLVFLDCTNTSAGSYNVVITNIAGAITSSVAVVTITNSLPIIMSPPMNQTVNLGANATFLVVAAGSQPRKYQWRHNGANVNSATNNYYRRSAIQASDAGSYSVVVSNSFGAVTSSTAMLSINFPPTITVQPISQTIDVGSNIVLQVQATGTAPMGYQWYAQWIGQPPGLQAIPDATTNVFITPAGDVTLAGTYSVLVYNIAGHVFSSNATVSVNGPPVVLQNPQDITVSRGSNAVFAVNAVGPNPLAYQWTHNGATIALATNSTYVRTNIQSADVGYYAVRITNSYGSITSGSASLTIDSFSVFFDNFEAGLGQWTTLAGATSLSNSTAQKHSGTNSALCGSSSGKMFHNLPFPVQGHARLTFWAYDNGGSLSNWFGEVRSYVGSTNGQPVQILGVGVFTYPFGTNETGDFTGFDVDTNYYQGFVLSGQSTGYFNLTDPFNPALPRTNGWHKFVIERETDAPSVDYFIDDNYIGTATYTLPADWDSVFIGSAGKGNTNGTVWFDDVKVEYLDPPLILTSPHDLSVHPGEGATFTVSAVGNVNSYQWLFNGSAIANATNSSYSIVGTQTNNAGLYSAIAINGIGGTWSNDGLLTVVPYPPTFTFTTSDTSLHLSSDKSSTIYSSTNLIDWVVFATNVTVLDVPFTNKLQFFKASVPTFP